MFLLLARVTTAQAPISEEAIIKQSANEIAKPSNQVPLVVDHIRKQPARRLPSTRTEIYEGRAYSKEEVIQLIKDYARQYGVNEDLPLRVARCESGYNQFSKNSHSTASGVFQYIAGTWRNTEAGRQGISPFDADANVRMAIKSIASGGISNWNASKHCWNI
jgi:soluble lytic murein transglycosylase-like protein